LKNKQRKAKKKAELEQQAQAAIAEKKEQHAKSKQASAEDGETHPPPSEELLPEKLASITDPLQQAVRFLIPLQSFASDKIDTHLLAYEIYSRKGKLLLMLQSIKRAFREDPRHPKLKKFLVAFHDVMEERMSSLSGPLPDFMRQEMDKIYSQVDLQTLKLEVEKYTNDVSK